MPIIGYKCNKVDHCCGAIYTRTKYCLINCIANCLGSRSEPKAPPPSPVAPFNNSMVISDDDDIKILKKIKTRRCLNQQIIQFEPKSMSTPAETQPDSKSLSIKNETHPAKINNIVESSVDEIPNDEDLDDFIHINDINELDK
jgi:hypothetical protein